MANKLKEELLYDFGFKNYQREDFSRASDIFRYLTICNPEEFRYWLALALSTFCEKKYEPAYNILCIAETKSGNDPRVILYKAECLIELNQDEQAKTELKKLNSTAYEKNSAFLSEVERVQMKSKRYRQ